MADIIFGTASVDAEVEKLCAPLMGIGYEQGRAGHQQFRWLCALALLVNRHPAAEQLSASTLVTVETLLTEVESLGSIRGRRARSEEHTSELQSHLNLVCRLLLEKKKQKEENGNDERLQL